MLGRRQKHPHLLRRPNRQNLEKKVSEGERGSKGERASTNKPTKRFGEHQIFDYYSRLVGSWRRNNQSLQTTIGGESSYEQPEKWGVWGGVFGDRKDFTASFGEVGDILVGRVTQDPSWQVTEEPKIVKKTSRWCTEREGKLIRATSI